MAMCLILVVGLAASASAAIVEIPITSADDERGGGNVDNIINDSGMTGTYPNLVHDTGTGYWEQQSQNTVLKFTFDDVYPVAEMWVWNRNTVDNYWDLRYPGEIQYSTNGTDWTVLSGWVNSLTGIAEFAQAPGTAGYAANTKVDFGGVAAKYVKFNAYGRSTVSMEAWDGGLRVSLSEVKFFTPEPASAVLLMLGLPLLARRRRG
jgi:hypothetical protein